ncbi:MAG: hypothetical protein JNM18_11310 [Planctomycetaceae bacterium]|nr:hypothetical protein [Planctomycetaceae bacterium]
MKSLSKPKPASRSKSVLVVEIGSNQVTLAEVSTRPQSDAVRMVEVFADLGTAAGDNHAAIAAAVAKACTNHRVSSREVVLLLPRSVVAVKTLKVPPCPPTERAQMVRLAVAGRSTVAIDDLCVGFVAPQDTADVACDVLVATLPKRAADAWQAAFSDLGLQVTSIGVQGLAVAEVLAAHGVVQGLAVYVNHHDCLAVSFDQGQVTALAQAAFDPAQNSAEQAATLIRRLRLQQKSDATSAPVYVACQDHSDFAASLRQQLGSDCEIHTLELTGDFHTTAAQGWRQGVIKSHALDLLAPVATAPQASRPRWIPIAAGIALCVTLGFAWHDHHQRVLDGQIEQLERQHQLLSNRIKQSEPLSKSFALIDKWSKTQVSWLDALSGLVDKWPDTKVAYVNQMRFETLDSNGQASVRLTGQATDTTSITGFQNAIIAESDRYELFPHGIRPGSENPDYPVHFDLEVHFHQRTNPTSH